MNEFNYINKACFTGYRPEKFDFKLNNKDAMYELLLNRINKTLNALIEDNCKVFYTGMAQGFDIICAEQVLNLKQKHSDIKLICCIPHEQQELSFSTEWRERFYAILCESDETVYVNREYSKWCYQERNKYMINNSDYVICWYDGKEGGTKNTIKYAQKKNKYIINLNTSYSENLNSTQLSFF